MKKLFLYITLLLLLFISTFYISRTIFDNKMKNKQQKENELTVKQNKPEEDFDVTNLESKSAIFLEESGENNPIEDNITIQEPEHTEADLYIVGIKNDYVIVYKNSLDCIFEYTGIDAKVIKCVNPKLYLKINDHIVFDSKEDLFDFLESLAS